MVGAMARRRGGYALRGVDEWSSERSPGDAMDKPFGAWMPRLLGLPVQGWIGVLIWLGSILIGNGGVPFKGAATATCDCGKSLLWLHLISVKGGDDISGFLTNLLGDVEKAATDAAKAGKQAMDMARPALQAVGIEAGVASDESGDHFYIVFREKACKKPTRPCKKGRAAREVEFEITGSASAGVISGIPFSLKIKLGIAITWEWLNCGG